MFFTSLYKSLHCVLFENSLNRKKRQIHLWIQWLILFLPSISFIRPTVLSEPPRYLRSCRQTFSLFLPVHMLRSGSGTHKMHSVLLQSFLKKYFISLLTLNFYKPYTFISFLTKCIKKSQLTLSLISPIIISIYFLLPYYVFYKAFDNY